MKEEYKSRVYTDRPAYADFDAPAKFQAIQGIIATRLRQHPKAICSYSGGADSDILIDLIERTREAFHLAPVKYVFFNTGLEMKATKDHVKATSEKYGVEIEECRPKIGIVQASRQYGIPFVSKIMSCGLEEWQKKGVPLSIAQEYEQAEDKAAKRAELKARYPKCEKNNKNLLAETIEGVVHALIVLGKMSKVLSEREYTVTIGWHDNIVIDENTLIDNTIKLYSAGLISREKAIMDIYKCDQKTAQEAAESIKRESAVGGGSLDFFGEKN